MVSQTSFNGHNDNRRLSRVFPSYISTAAHQDRRFHAAGRESRTIITTEHQTENMDAPARKRIAVACGRCRQRKIRCSGDLGQNMPCSNCKNAGVSQCLFLRVSSREAPIKGDTSTGGSGGEFDYNSAAARALAHRSSVSPATPYIGPHDLNNDIYRSGDFYPYGSKAYYTNVQGWGSNYGGDYSNYNVPSNYGNGSYLVSCPWAGRSKPSNLGAATVNAQESDFAQPAQALPSHADISNESEVSLSAFDSTLPDTEAEQVRHFHGMAVGRALQTVRGAGYGDHVLSCFKSSGGSSGLMAVPASVSDSCETLAAYNNGNLDSSNSRHTNVSTYSANSTLGHGNDNHEAAFQEPETYDIGTTSESIFTEQERGVGTQGPGVSLNSYTYNPTGRPVQSYHRPGKLNSASHVHNQTYIPTDGPVLKNQTGSLCAPTSLTELGVGAGRHETGGRG